MPSRTNKKRARNADGPRVIRKYSNRRLYDTTTGAFVTLEDLRRMVVEGKPFVVEDAKEGKDITPSILAQIIAEQQGRGESVLPGELMRKLIALYDNGMSESFFEYLQESMDSFAKNLPGLEPYSEISRRNMDMFRKSYESFFGAFDPAREAGGPEDAKPEPSSKEHDGPGDEVSDLQRKLDDMQKEIERLRAKRGEPSSGKNKD